MNKETENLSFVVLGASGDLARKMIFPSLFGLYCQDFLPKDYHVFGFARSPMSDEQFRNRIMENLTCRYAPGESCAQKMEEFLARCHYSAGSYDSTDAFLDLFQLMREKENREPTNRFYYLAIPPSVFIDSARAIGNAGLVNCTTDRPWSHVVVEKPFGSDRASSDELTKAIAEVFSERQTYRIDHYLGKEVIQNLLVLRFANMLLEPVWNKKYIEGIEVIWKENIGTQGRAGYFDQYGVIRDVMQNHLLQILALVAMEPPQELNADSIAAAKTELLKCISPIQLEDMVIGQFTEGMRKGKTIPGYLDDDGVPHDSRTPTYAITKLAINNDRWEGVPFIIRAGKGLDAKMTEIRIHFKDVSGNMFCNSLRCPEPNRLTIRVQPDEAIYLSLMNKVPGMGMRLASRNLDLQYKEAFEELIPGAYESLLMDVVRGDQSLFIRSSELEAAWDVFTPVLHEIEEKKIVPKPYPFGSRGPDTGERFKI